MYSSTLLIQNHCRTCLRKKENAIGKKSRPFISLYEKQDTEEYGSISIIEMLKKTFPQLSLSDDDQLPKIICEICLKKLKDINKFQSSALKAEHKLRSIISEIRKEISSDPLNIRRNVRDKSGDDYICKPITNNLSILQKSDKIVGVCNVDDTLEVRTYKSQDPLSWNRKINQTDQNSTENVKNCYSQAKVMQKECDVEEIREKLKITVNTTDNSKGNNGHQYKALTTNQIDNNIENVKDDAQIEYDASDMTIDRAKNPNSNRDLEYLRNSFKRPKTTCSINKDKPEVNQKEKLGSNSLEQKNDTIETEGFPCKKCGIVLKTSSELKVHLIRHHLKRHTSNKVKSIYKCKHCDKEFKRSTNLRNHEIIHTGERPFLCSTCGKSFNNSWSLKMHYERHSTDLKYECPHCPKRFRSSDSVSAHKAKVHSNVRPHVCSICGASFKKPYSLTTHKAIHGEKKHKCDFCERKFAQVDQCRRHMRTHTGEKPYKCKYCDQAYAQSNDMIKHMRIHLGDNVYRCELCPKGFRLLCELRKHFSTHKEDDEETKLTNLQDLRIENERIQAKLKADLEIKKNK